MAVGPASEGGQEELQREGVGHLAQFIGSMGGGRKSCYCSAVEFRTLRARRTLTFNLFAIKGVGVAPNDFSKQVWTPFYAEAHAGFPHGFEVKIDGSEAGWLLLVRLALTSNRPGRLNNTAIVTRTTTIRGN